MLHPPTHTPTTTTPSPNLTHQPQPFNPHPHLTTQTPHREMDSTAALLLALTAAVLYASLFPPPVRVECQLIALIGSSRPQASHTGTGAGQGVESGNAMGCDGRGRVFADSGAMGWERRRKVGEGRRWEGSCEVSGWWGEGI